MPFRKITNFENVSLLDYLKFLKEKWVLIPIVVLIFAILSIIAASIIPLKYSSSAQVKMGKIFKRNYNFIEDPDTASMWYSSEFFLEQLLKKNNIPNQTRQSISVSVYKVNSLGILEVVTKSESLELANTIEQMVISAIIADHLKIYTDSTQTIQDEIVQLSNRLSAINKNNEKTNIKLQNAPSLKTEGVMLWQLYNQLEKEAFEVATELFKAKSKLNPLYQYNSSLYGKLKIAKLNHSYGLFRYIFLASLFGFFTSIFITFFAYQEQNEKNQLTLK